MHQRVILKNFEQLPNSKRNYVSEGKLEPRNWENQVSVQFTIYNDPNWNLIHSVSLPQSLKIICHLVFGSCLAFGKLLLTYNPCFNCMYTSSFVFRTKCNYLLKCNIIVKFQCRIALAYEKAFYYEDFVNRHARAAVPGYFSITH